MPCDHEQHHHDDNTLSAFHIIHDNSVAMIYSHYLLIIGLWGIASALRPNHVLYSIPHHDLMLTHLKRSRSDSTWQVMAVLGYDHSSTYRSSHVVPPDRITMLQYRYGVYIARIDVIIWAELNAMRALHAVHQGSYHHMQCAKYYDHCTGIRTSYYLYKYI
jgi:hypothetical protein